MANYYLLLWVQAWQHIILTSTLNKWHTKLNEAYYQPDHLWTDSKAIRELHKNTSITKKDVKPWLVKQALWQVHIPPLKKTTSLRCFKTWWAALVWSGLCNHNVFEGNTYNYKLTGVNPIQGGLFCGCSRMEEGGGKQKSPSSLKYATHPT